MYITIIQMKWAIRFSRLRQGFLERDLGVANFIKCFYITSHEDEFSNPFQPLVVGLY